MKNVAYAIYDFGRTVKWLQRADGVFLVDPVFEMEFLGLFVAAERIDDFVNSL